MKQAALGAAVAARKNGTPLWMAARKMKPNSILSWV
jgi:hypothetical protein